MKIRLFITLTMFSLSFLLFGQSYSPGLDENDIINYLKHFESITKEYQEIYTDEIKKIDNMSIQFSYKIAFYLYDNENTLYNDYDIRNEFHNIVSTFYPPEVYEIMERYGIHNKNFILLFTVINLIHTIKLYINEELSDHSKLNFLLDLIDKQDINLVEKYYEDFVSMLE